MVGCISMIIKKDIKKVINEIFGEMNLKDFYNRLKIQKAVYILQYMNGIKKPYISNWYIYGPYSPSLTYDVFRAYNFNEKKQINVDVNKFKYLKDIIAKLTKDVNIKTARNLELLSSILYMSKEKGVPLSDENKLISILDIEKPNFSKEDVKKMLKFAQKWFKSY